MKKNVTQKQPNPQPLPKWEGELDGEGKQQASGPNPIAMRLFLNRYLAWSDEVASGKRVINADGLGSTWMGTAEEWAQIEIETFQA